MYQLKNYNKNYKYVILDKSIKNLFIASILLGINNKNFNNDNKKLNESIKEYNIKLNNLIKEKLNNNENFKKFKKSHLKILEELIKLNIIIYDNIDNKIIYKNNKYNKNIVLLKEKSNYLLLLKHENNKKITKLSNKSINESLPIIRNNKQETKEENNQKNKKTKEKIKEKIKEEVEKEVEEQKGGGDNDKTEKIIDDLIDDCLINKLSEYHSNQIYQNVDKYINDIIDENLSNENLSIQDNLNKINDNEITNKITNLILNDNEFKKLKDNNIINNLIFNISMNLIIKSYDNSDNFITDDLEESVNYTKTNIQTKYVSVNNFELPITNETKSFNGHETVSGTPPSLPSPLPNNVQDLSSPISSVPGTPPRKRHKSNNRQNGNGVSKKGGANDYTIFKRTFLNNSNNVFFQSEVDNYNIKKLLETGIDSFHDFGKLIHITRDDEVNKGDIFDTFLPEKINKIWEYNRNVQNITYFTTYLLELFFETFNNKIVQNISTKYPTLNNASNIKIEFKPRISQKKNITSNYQPFSEGWEKNATNYYIYGNTEKKQRTQNFFRNSKDKTIIIFQDSQGASESVLSYFGNVLMRPGSFYSSLDNINDITKQQIIDYLQSLQPNNTSQSNANDYIDKNYKVLMYNQLKKQILQKVGTEILATNEKSWYMETPASAVDGAGKNYLNFANFQDNIEKINEICELTDNNNNNKLKLKNIIIHENNFYIKNNTGDSNYNLYSLIIEQNGTEIIDILNETYKEHFNNITYSTYRTNSDNLNLNKSGFYNMNGTINYNFDIKFQIVLNKKEVNKEERLYPVLLMFHDFNNANYNKMASHDTIKKRVDRIEEFYTGLKFENNTILNIIDLENLNDLTKLSNLINQYYRTGKNFNFLNNNNDAITKKFKDIYNILECWTILIEKITNPGGVKYNNFWNYGNINTVFLRILYTLKMIGDHGQVNYIKALKEHVPNFRENVSVLFTTGDSLARLYACVNGITNVSTVTSDFPSEDYCSCTPKGMVYYPETERVALFQGQFQQANTNIISALYSWLFSNK